MLTGEALKPDPALSWPLACRILTPLGLVDLGERLPVRGGITLEHVGPEEVEKSASDNGTTYTRAIEAGTDCPPDDLEDSETSTTTITQKADGTTETVTVNVKKTVNPDGTITTETTETRDGVQGETKVETRAEQLARLGGVRLQIRTEYGAEFSLIRPLTKLKVGDVVQVTENYTDRTELRLWTNAVVSSAPRWPFVANGNYREFYNIELDLLIVGATP